MNLSLMSAWGLAALFGTTERRSYAGQGNPVNRRKRRMKQRARRKAEAASKPNKPTLATVQIQGPEHLNKIASKMDPKTLRRIRRKTGGNRTRHILSRSAFE